MNVASFPHGGDEVTFVAPARSRKIGALVTVGALIATTAAASARTYVPRGDPDDAAAYKPRSFVAGSGVACGVFMLGRLHRTSWGWDRARARGRVRYNTGETCADGEYTSYRARIKIYRPRRGCRIYLKDRGYVRTRKRLVTRISVYTLHDRQTFRSTTTVGSQCG